MSINSILLRACHFAPIRDRDIIFFFFFFALLMQQDSKKLTCEKPKMIWKISLMYLHTDTKDYYILKFKHFFRLITCTAISNTRSILVSVFYCMKEQYQNLKQSWRPLPHCQPLKTLWMCPQIHYKFKHFFRLITCAAISNTRSILVSVFYCMKEQYQNLKQSWRPLPRCQPLKT